MEMSIPTGDESEEFAAAEFNSPFKVFSLVMELRDANSVRSETIITQRPLAIYVPSEGNELWRTGRKEYVRKAKLTM
jgi:hypothetical protein